MKKSVRYSPKVRERAGRMALEHQGEQSSQWAVIGSIASKIGCTPDNLALMGATSRTLSRDSGGSISAELERLKALEREVRELKRANEILRKASAYL